MALFIVWKANVFEIGCWLLSPGKLVDISRFNAWSVGWSLLLNHDAMLTGLTAFFNGHDVNPGW